ncbi:MAG TPA: substrate-binding domain-containing protein [Gemmatimonadaceae bacterium]|nr:substrate-binding domain-containing protein [Gemmatimonadaceae bacterium]
MRGTRKLFRYLAGAACAAGMVACGAGNDAGSDAQGGASNNGSTFTIAMIAKSSTNPVFLSARTGAEKAAEELSKEHGVNVKINWLTPPSENAELQAQRIAQAVNSGSNAILVSASDAGKITGAINEAVDRGVPVMSFDSDAPDSKRFSFYGGDDHAMGSQVMSELAKQMNGKGKIAILSGNQNAPNLQKRVQGVLDEAKKYPGITIVNTFYTIETPQDAAAEVLRAQQAYPEIQGWAMVGGWALFTRALLTDLDPKKVKIVSVDALPVELAYIDAGLTPVLLAQPTYLWGYQSVHTIFDHVYLKKEVPAHVQMELVRVSEENLGDWARQLQEWGYPDVDPKYLSLGK